MKRAEFIIGTIVGVIILPTLFFVFPYLKKDTPIISDKQSHETISFNINGGGAKIIEAVYIKENTVFCLTDYNINTHLGVDFFKYNTDTSNLSKNNKVAMGETLTPVACRKKYCNDLYFDSPLHNIKIYIKYKGLGILNTSKTTCGNSSICLDYFDRDSSNCKEVKH